MPIFDPQPFAPILLLGILIMTSSTIPEVSFDHGVFEVTTGSARGSVTLPAFGLVFVYHVLSEFRVAPQPPLTLFTLFTGTSEYPQLAYGSLPTNLILTERMGTKKGSVSLSTPRRLAQFLRLRLVFTRRTPFLFPPHPVGTRIFISKYAHIL